ncbi:hypothetical protein [Aliikangiella sp. IMCC44359]|uniref:hypothetical protein n=1 Tax=Aliikangiella sp. IMCC44359 TaxID=3459125 RepID=UPI00403B1ECD
MRLIVFLIILCSFDVFACVPCDKNATKMIFKVPAPNFPQSYHSERDRGYVKYKVGNGNRNLEKQIEIIELSPPDAPRTSILKMLSKVEYRYVIKKGHYSGCIESYEFEIEFQLPQRIKIDNEVKLPLPKIKINQSLQLNDSVKQ